MNGFNFSTKGGFGAMLANTQAYHQINEAATPKGKITTTMGKVYDLDPALAKEVANSPTSGKAMSDDFPKWIYFGLLAAKFKGETAKKAYTKIMNAIADGSLPNGITINPNSGAIDITTQKWVKAK